MYSPVNPTQITVNQLETLVVVTEKSGLPLRRKIPFYLTITTGGGGEGGVSMNNIYYTIFSKVPFLSLCPIPHPMRTALFKQIVETLRKIQLQVFVTDLHTTHCDEFISQVVYNTRSSLTRDCMFNTARSLVLQTLVTTWSNKLQQICRQQSFGVNFPV